MNRTLLFLQKALRLPVQLVAKAGALIFRALVYIFDPLLTRIDASSQLSELIDSLSSAMATRRGLPLITGTVILIASLIMHGVVLVILVASDNFSRNLYLLCIPFTLLHVGVLAGFTGAMLATPLGQGYKDK